MQHRCFLVRLPDSLISLAYILYQSFRRLCNLLSQAQFINHHCSVNSIPCVVISIFSTWTFPPISGIFRAVMGFSHSFQAVLSFFFSHFLACSNAFDAFYKHTRYTTHQVFLPLFIMLILLIIFIVLRNISTSYDTRMLIKFRGM